MVEKNWDRCKFVVSRSQDVCKEGSWVFFNDPILDNVCVGRIHSILTQSGTELVSKNVSIILELFDVSATKDSRLNMPILIHSAGSYVAQPADILFIFNAQHDCVHAGCSIVTGSAHIYQERIETAILKNTLVHKDDNRYIINPHALHNAHMIREILPRSLVAPVPYLENRQKKHNELAAQLRLSNPAKRAISQAKGKETKQRNKKVQEEKNKHKGPPLERVDEEGEGV